MPRPDLRKALVIILLLAAFTFGLSACGGGEAKPIPTPTPTPVETPARTLTPMSTPTSVPTATPLPRAASLVVTPTAVKPGGNVEILGAGFLPEEALTVELVGASQGGNITLATGVMTNSYGTFTAIAPISSNSSTGVFTLRVSGSQGSLVTMPLVIVKESK